MKNFTGRGQLTETRLFMRHDDGGWNGYTYEWLDDEATPSCSPPARPKTVGTQTWTSRAVATA